MVEAGEELRDDGLPLAAGRRLQPGLQALLQLEGVLHRQLQEAQRGRDQLIAVATLVEGDVLEVGMKSWLYIVQGDSGGRVPWLG